MFCRLGRSKPLSPPEEYPPLARRIFTQSGVETRRKLFWGHRPLHHRVHRQEALRSKPSVGYYLSLHPPAILSVFVTRSEHLDRASEAVMEKTPVIIVGAGPAGLALALALAKFQVKVSRHAHYPGIACHQFLIRYIVCDIREGKGNYHRSPWRVLDRRLHTNFPRPGHWR